MIQALSREGAPRCADPGQSDFRGSLWYLCVDLAASLGDARVSPAGYGGFAENLLEWREIGQEKRAHAVYEAAALGRASAGDDKGAADLLRQGLLSLEKRESLTGPEASYFVLRSVTLNDLALKSGAPPLEAEIELAGSVTAAERLIPRGERERLMELPFLYWYQARALRSQNRRKESAAAFQKAERSLGQLNRSYPQQKAELQRLAGMIKDDKNWRYGRNAKDPPPFPNSPRIFYPAWLEAAKRPDGRVSPPAAMRAELEALKFLDRAGEFEAAVEKALSSSPDGSPDRIRYESLKLKYLEETGRVDELLAELNSLFESPPGEDASSRTLFKSSVKAYEGRVRKSLGDKPGARRAWQTALELSALVRGTDAKQGELRADIAALDEEGPAE
jgi:hypothetical protein